MNNSSNIDENEAQDYYPKAMSYDKQTEKAEPQSPPQPNLSSLFSQGNPLFSQLLGSNPLLSTLFSGGMSQNDMISKLLPSLLSQNKSKDDGKEKVIDLKNSIEEL